MTETTKTISDYFTTETLSGYGVIKVVNEILHDLGIEKVLPGPMGYTYIKKGYIGGVKDPKATRCTKEAAIEWTEKYIAKLIGSVTEEVVEIEMTEPLDLDI